MKITNAFSISMVDLPANVSFCRITVDRIRELISDSTEKQLARELIAQHGLHADIDDEETIAYVNGGYVQWFARDSKEENMESLAKIGLPANKETLDAVYSAIYGDAEVVSLESAIGHADTARIVSGMLGVELPANRVNVKLAKGEKMIVAQYSGPRLPEGATTLPDGAKIEFVMVGVE